MSSCQNCQVVILALKREIQERQGRERELQQSNDNLMELLNNQQLNQEEESDWKQRYEKQRQINLILQSKIKKEKNYGHFSSDRKRSLLYQPKVCPFTTKRSSSKENIQSKHQKKMSQLMKAIVIEKAKQRQFSSRCSNREGGTRQIILRIVDDRLNRQF